MYVVFVAITALLVLSLFVPVRPPHRCQPAGEHQPSPRTEPTGALVVHAVATVDGEREESVLVARRFADDLSPARYQQGMAGLARKDALRHPVVIPPNHGS